MTYYIQHDNTGSYWNAEKEIWQEDLTVICAFEDYETAMIFANKSDLSNFKIKIWD